MSYQDDKDLMEGQPETFPVPNFLAPGTSRFLKVVEIDCSSGGFYGHAHAINSLAANASGLKEIKLTFRDADRFMAAAIDISAALPACSSTFGLPVLQAIFIPQDAPDITPLPRNQYNKVKEESMVAAQLLSHIKAPNLTMIKLIGDEDMSSTLIPALEAHRCSTGNCGFVLDKEEAASLSAGRRFPSGFRRYYYTWKMIGGARPEPGHDMHEWRSELPAKPEVLPKKSILATVSKDSPSGTANQSNTDTSNGNKATQEQRQANPFARRATKPAKVDTRPDLRYRMPAHIPREFARYASNYPYEDKSTEEEFTAFRFDLTEEDLNNLDNDSDAETEQPILNIGLDDGTQAIIPMEPDDDPAQYQGADFLFPVTSVESEAESLGGAGPAQAIVDPGVVNNTSHYQDVDDPLPFPVTPTETEVDDLEAANFAQTIVDPDVENNTSQHQGANDALPAMSNAAEAGVEESGGANSAQTFVDTGFHNYTSQHHEANDPSTVTSMEPAPEVENVRGADSPQTVVATGFDNNTSKRQRANNALPMTLKEAETEAEAEAEARANEEEGEDEAKVEDERSAGGGPHPAQPTYHTGSNDNSVDIIPTEATQANGEPRERRQRMGPDMVLMEAWLQERVAWWTWMVCVRLGLIPAPPEE